MFRSSRPDYIETEINGRGVYQLQLAELFRSSRPDYIETELITSRMTRRQKYCSGLPDRTTLRLQLLESLPVGGWDCSGLPDRTTLRQQLWSIVAL